MCMKLGLIIDIRETTRDARQIAGVDSLQVFSPLIVANKFDY